MLKNISPLISPSLLKILAEMGHGDEIVFSDAHFPGHTFNPTVLEAKYRKALNYDGEIEQMERYAFYERAKKAYAVVITGETAKYGNIILKKGVTPLS